MVAYWRQLWAFLANAIAIVQGVSVGGVSWFGRSSGRSRRMSGLEVFANGSNRLDGKGLSGFGTVD